MHFLPFKGKEPSIHCWNGILTPGLWVPCASLHKSSSGDSVQEYQGLQQDLPVQQGTWKGNWFSWLSDIPSNEPIYCSLGVLLLGAQRAPSVGGRSGTRVKMAFLYLHSCDVRRWDPLYLLPTEIQDKLPEPTKTTGSPAFPWKHWTERSCGLTLGVLANRPARVSRMLVISRISLSYNRKRTRKMRKDKGGRKSYHDRAPRSCKSGLA